MFALAVVAALATRAGGFLAARSTGTTWQHQVWTDEYPDYEPEEGMPTVAEALKGADEYDGPNPIFKLHPNDIPLDTPFTCETFSMDYDTDGHAPWEFPNEVAMAMSFDARGNRGLRKSTLMDHLYWSRFNHMKGYEARIHDSITMLNPDNGMSVYGSILTATSPSHEQSVELLQKDPFFLAGLFDRRHIYRYVINNDPYMQYDTYEPREIQFVIFRPVDALPDPEDLEYHYSFLRHTKRVMRTGFIYDEQNKIVAELTFTYHPTREHVDFWLARDPLQIEPLWVCKYSTLDHTGLQITHPYPLNLNADPLKARLAEDGFFEFPTRTLQRIVRDEETGKYVTLNITTDDPRMRPNIPTPPTDDFGPSDLPSSRDNFFSFDAYDDEDDDLATADIYGSVGGADDF